MNYRDWLQQVIYKIINPVVRGMIKIGITPNFITTTGLVLNIVAAGVLIYGGINGERGDLSYLLGKCRSNRIGYKSPHPFRSEEHTSELQSRE